MRTFRVYGCKGDIADAVVEAIKVPTRNTHIECWYDERWADTILAVEFRRRKTQGHIRGVLLVFEDASMDGLPSAKAREVLQASELRYKSCMAALKVSAGDDKGAEGLASLIRKTLCYGLRVRNKDCRLKIVPSPQCKAVDAGSPNVVAVEIKEGHHVRWRVLCLLDGTSDKSSWEGKCNKIRKLLREINSDAR